MDRIRYLVLGLLLCVPVVQGTELAHFPGSEEVSKTEDLTDSSRRLILGSLVKINNLLEPERVEYITGSRKSSTYYIPDERRTDKIAEFYRRQLGEQGSILFDCSGRTCGSSNYWANTIFGESILYGPEQYQHYLLARLGDDEHVAVYVAMRGTRKIYVHVEYTRKDVGASIRTSLETSGRYVFVTDEQKEVVSKVVEFMQGNPDSVYMVVHGASKTGESVTQAVKRSLATANSLREGVIAGGVDGDRVLVSGFGPLAPDSEFGPDRIELIVPANLSGN